VHDITLHTSSSRFLLDADAGCVGGEGSGEVRYSVLWSYAADCGSEGVAGLGIGCKTTSVCPGAQCLRVLCCAVLCCAVPRCAVLCRAVLCCAVPCCAVLCCAVLQVPSDAKPKRLTLSVDRTINVGAGRFALAAIGLTAGSPQADTAGDILADISSSAAALQRACG